MTDRLCLTHLNGYYYKQEDSIVKSGLVFAFVIFLTISVEAQLLSGSSNTAAPAVSGTNTSTGRAGLFVINNSGSTAEALFGQTNGNGTGVYGFANKTFGNTVGVYGRSASGTGRGVVGWASSLTGKTTGVMGWVDSPEGIAMRGTAAALTGTTYGIYGHSISTAGIGVYGWASATSGTTYGVFGQCSSPSGYAGHFLGRGYFSGNVGIGVTDPIQQLDVAGRMRLVHGIIQNGTTPLTSTSDLGLYSQVAGGWMRFVTTNAPFQFFTDGGIGTNPVLTINNDGRIGHRGSYTDVNFNIRNSNTAIYPLYVETAGRSRLMSISFDGRLHVSGLTNVGDFRNMQYNDVTKEVGWDTSSLRYKENITPLEDDFFKVLLMEPKTYTRINGDPNRWEIGYIAEEAHDLGLNRLVEYDIEGRPDGFNYEKMILYLNEMIKIQQEQIRELQKEVQILKARQ